MEQQVINEHCADLRDAGIIEPAHGSLYVSAPVIAAKKDEHGEWTLSVNYPTY